jgi:ankyrin repeat protein
LIKTTPSAQLRESLFPVISSLARHVSELCDVFLRFEARYRVENVVPSGVSEFESSEEEKHTTSRKSRQWPSTGEIGFSAMDHIASIEQLRACFAPVRRGKMTAISSDEYFKALKVLSHSSHFIHDGGMAPNAYHYSGSLWAIYGPEIRRILLHEVRGGCVQVTAANGTGKSAVIKLVSQHLRTQSPLVVVDNFCVPLLDPDQPIPLYSVLVSTLHQILSQKPSLFSPSVQIFMSEMIRKNSWNEEMVAHLLSVLFTTSRNTDFLIVIHDYDSPLWPEATREWWSSLPNLLAGSPEEEDAVDSSSCTLLMSSDRKGQATVSQMNCHQLDLSKDYESKKQRFVEEACTRMLAEVGLTTLGLLQSVRGLEFVKKEIISRATGFSGSFSATSGYLSHLLRCCCTLSTPEVILQSIVPLPQTTGEFCRYQLRLLSKSADNVLPWATSVLSWVSLAARPLRTGELAMAAALRPDQKSMGESDVAVYLDIEVDIRANLAGILCVEDGFVRITNPIVRVALLDGISRRGKDNTDTILKLMGDPEIVLRCLNYLSIIFTQPPGSSNDMDQALLDYTVRYWPVHFSRVENPDEELCEKVAAFLDDETTADKWFRLYLELNCLPPNFPFTDNESGNPKVPPAVMASLTGLQEALSHLRPARSISTTDVYSPRKILARRGSWEQEMVFLSDLAASQLFLEHAIGTDDLSEVVALLSESSPHRNSTIDNRPLHLAALAGSPRMVEVLVGDAGIWESASVADQEGRTALHWAALGGRCDVIKMLVNKSLPSAVYEIQDANSETALLLATRAGNELAARVLMEHGEKDGTVRPLDLRDKMGRQPIHHAVISCPSLLRHGSPMAAVKTLLEPDKDGFTALHIAAYSGCVDATAALLNIASKLSSPMEVLLAKDTTGKQPLHHAAEQGHVEVLSLLLKYKNDWISSDGHSDGVSGESASLDQNDPNFATPGELAARHGHLDALRKFHSPGEELGSSILAEAAGAGQLLIVQHLLLNNANPDGKSRSGDTPLGLAATGGFSQIVRSLLKRGADVNLPNRKRQTPLYLGRRAQKERTC